MFTTLKPPPTESPPTAYASHQIVCVPRILNWFIHNNIK